MSQQIQGLSADQILSQFETLIQDSLDQTTELFLLNEVKDTIEAERQWAWLIGKDTSKTRSIADTFLTPYTLPANFGQPSPRGIYVGTDLVPYRQIPFEAQEDFQSITYAYYIDYYNGNYYICGQGNGGVITFFYRITSAQMALAANGGTPWVFPARFHPILPYEMAIKFFAMDQGSKAKAWDDRWAQYAARIREAMYSWDDSLQMEALQTEKNLFVDPASFPNIIDMGGTGPGGVMFG